MTPETKDAIERDIIAIKMADAMEDQYDVGVGWTQSALHALEAIEAAGFVVVQKTAADSERLREIVRELSICLTGLTPGGSEFMKQFDDDLFYADTEACERFVRRELEAAHQARIAERRCALRINDSTGGRRLLNQAVFDVLEKTNREMTVSEIANALPGKPITNVSNALRYRRDTRDDIETPRHGVWRLKRGPTK